MSTFERIDKYEVRERDYEREYRSIELTDEEYLAKIKQFRVPLPEVVEKIFDLIENGDYTLEKVSNDEQIKNEKPKRRAVKNNRKADKAAVERVQKKL